MVSGVDLNATWEFVLPSDKKNPTTWKLGLLSSTVMTILADNMTDKYAQSMLKVVRIGLRGWSNFKIGGKDVTFQSVKEDFHGEEVQMVAKDLVDAIPTNAVMALATEIQAKSGLSGAEEKN